MPAAATEAEDLSARVIRVIAETQHISPATITIDSTFEELKIDSLDGINLVFALENEFGIEIPDQSAQSMQSVRQVADGVEQLVSAKKRALPPEQA